jgi:hypothetical protein
VNRALPLALLAEAIRVAEQGDHDVSVVVAASAVQALAARTVVAPGSTTQAAWDSLSDVVDGVVAGTRPPAADDSLAVINAAAALIAERLLHVGEPTSHG